MNLMRRWKFHIWYSRGQSPPWDTNITPPELMEFITSHPAGRALDLGCGTGTNVITLARQGWQVTGVDFAWRAIRIAQRKARQAGVNADLQVNDVTRLAGIAGPFDLVLDIGCFHNLPDAGRPAYLLQLKRLLNPTGTYLLYVHFKPEAADRGHGVVEADLKNLESFMHLLSRQDGTDRGHHSAWLAYTPAPPPG